MSQLYTFIFKNGGWWLLVDNFETLKVFHDATDHITYGDAYLFSLDRENANGDMSKAMHSTYTNQRFLDATIKIITERDNLTYKQAAITLMKQVLARQKQLILEGKTLYINSAGGYHIKASNEPARSYVHLEKLVFPHLKDTSIRVRQFPDGTHWYARVGNIEVKDVYGNIKWNTYDEAYTHAKALLEK